jgi:hypothetical protein
MTVAGRLPRDGKDVKELKEKAGVGAVVALNEAGDHYDPNLTLAQSVCSWV